MQSEIFQAFICNNFDDYGLWKPFHNILILTLVFSKAVSHNGVHIRIKNWFNVRLNICVQVCQSLETMPKQITCLAYKFQIANTLMWWISRLGSNKGNEVSTWPDGLESVSTMGKEGQQCFRLIYNTHKSHTAPAYLKDTTFHVHVNVYYRVSLSSSCCIYVCVSLSIWTLTTFSSHYQFFCISKWWYNNEHRGAVKLMCSFSSSFAGVLAQAEQNRRWSLALRLRAVLWLQDLQHRARSVLTLLFMIRFKSFVEERWDWGSWIIAPYFMLNFKILGKFYFLE